MQHSEEVVTTSQAFGRRVKELRARRNFRSAAALADAVTAHGVRVNRAAVTNIENEHRESITVDEVHAFALALNTSPANLVAGFDDLRYRVGDIDLNQYALLAWWRGEPAPHLRDESDATEWQEVLDFYAVAEPTTQINFLTRNAPGVEDARDVQHRLRQAQLGVVDRAEVRAELEAAFGRLESAVKATLDELGN